MATIMTGKIGLKDLTNMGLGTIGGMFSTFTAGLESLKKEWLNKGTKTALNKIRKIADPAIEKMGKFSKNLGLAGLAINAGFVVKDYFFDK